MERLKSALIAKMPAGQEFNELSKSQENIEHGFEAIVRAWCYNYKLPTSLINLDLPSHSTVTVGASYGHFIRQCMRPMLEPVINAIAFRIGVTIKINYRNIEKESTLENAEGVMKLSQTGVYTINEIRAIEVIPRGKTATDIRMLRERRLPMGTVAGAIEIETQRGNLRNKKKMPILFLCKRMVKRFTGGSNGNESRVREEG